MMISGYIGLACNIQSIAIAAAQSTESGYMMDY